MNLSPPSEISALGMHTVKHTWLTSADDTAASSKAQWRRFRERALTGFICQMAPVVWDLSMPGSKSAFAPSSVHVQTVRL